MSKLQELVMDREAWHAAAMESQSKIRLSDSTELIPYSVPKIIIDICLC